MRFKAIAFTPLLVLAAVPASPPYQEPSHHYAATWASDDSRIAYAAERAGQGRRIYVVSSKGGKAEVLIPGDEWMADPAWSPDGKRFAYVSGRGAASARVWVANADGGDGRPITSAMFGTHRVPSWSPDGKWIAYSAFTGPNPRITIIPAEGGGERVLGDGWRPRWSPDGSRILFTASSGEQSGPSAVASSVAWIVDAGGGKPKRLDSSLGVGANWAPSGDWSPDGHRVVLPRLSKGHSELVIIDVDADRVVASLPVAGIAADPAWSHDGKRIAFTEQSAEHAGEIHTLTVDGGRLVEVTRQPRFATVIPVQYRSPDGLEIPSYLAKPSGKGRHPALVWVHGGEPGTGSVDSAFDPAMQYFAAQGYIVLAPNYRGSRGFGDILQNFGPGTDPIPDLLAAATYLRSRPDVDPNRMGIVGFSAGGLFTLLTAGRQPGVFAAVVDFFGPTDLATLHRDTPVYRPLLRGLLGGDPADKEDAYRGASPLTYVERMKAPILVLHGDQDMKIPVAQADTFVAALTAAHKQVTFVRIPGAGHGFEGADASRAYEQTAEFLARVLLENRGAESKPTARK